MRLYRTAILAGALAIASSTVNAGYHHVVIPVVKVVAPKAAPPIAHHGHGQRFICVANPAGFFICAVAVAIIVHEVRGPACASNSKYNVGHGYDTPTLWRPLCKFKRDPSARAAKLWPHGK